MKELFDAPAAPARLVAGRILIVDDDPIVAGMLGISLAAAGHGIVEANSGEDALARLDDWSVEPLPDVVILDIEMGMGIDGYETCRRLKEADGTRDVPVIFLSGHDELEDRLRAYDAGGDDFMAKPFDPDEVLRKVAAAIRHRHRLLATAVESRSSFNAAMTAMTTLGESGVTLNFSRGALGCRTQAGLAQLIIESMAAFGIESHVQIRLPQEILTLTPQGAASPLEESVFEKMRTMGRIFSFKNRMIINHGTISILVTNMPVADDDLCGRIRDHGAMIAEAAALAVDNIHLRTQTIRRAGELRSLADASRTAVETLRGAYRDLQISTRLELETMTHSIEGMYVHLALTDKQEFAISDTVRDAVERVLALFERSSELDKSFAGIVEGLTQASDIDVSQDDETSSAVELW